MYNGILDKIGNTPLFSTGKVYAKLEYFNPFGSIKDRAALYIINDAEKRGLKRGMTVAEATSGNMGIALAAICKIRGYKSVIAMPENMSVERVKLMKYYGAEVILTPRAKGMLGSVEYIKNYCGESGAFFADQFNNPMCVLAHEQTTAPEICKELGSDNITFVCGAGTGGTAAGLSKYLRANCKNSRVFAVEPATSQMIGKGFSGAHSIAGIGANFYPPLLKGVELEGVIPISDSEAFEKAKELVSFGIRAGISSGANYAAALKLASEGYANVVTVFPDDSSKYMASVLFKED